jgi:hypothetical protein
MGMEVTEGKEERSINMPGGTLLLFIYLLIQIDCNILFGTKKETI